MSDAQVQAASDAPVLVERNGAVGTLVLNRPAKRNALDLTMRKAIAAAITELQGDTAIRAIVITGSSTVFAAGADLNFLLDKNARDMAAIDLAQYWAPVANCTKPVIAAVGGFALGAGCELAMMCDFIVADSTARFGQPELAVGIMPGAGGTQRLVRTLGKQVASMLLLTGEMLEGQRAFELGLVAVLAPDGGALEKAQALALKAARMPPLAVAATRRVLREGSDLPLDTALALEKREFLQLFDTQDKAEGMQAFLDKRKPVFKGE
jgi:enoyl-CoA hydratase